MLAQTLYMVAARIAGHENAKIYVEEQSEDTFFVFGTAPGPEGRRVVVLEGNMSFLTLTCESESDLEILFQTIMSQIDPPQRTDLSP